MDRYGDHEDRHVAAERAPATDDHQEELDRPPSPAKVAPLTALPEIPSGTGFDFADIFGHPEAESTNKVNKRASNVQKLTEENEKLKEQLKAMSDRLEAAERRRRELAHKEQRLMEPPTS